MEDYSGLLCLGVVVGAVVGGIIGASRNNAESGVVWGGLLGPIGWLIILFLDKRPKCPECRGVLPEGARRCQHCGHDFIATTSRPVSGVSQAQPLQQVQEKKCPFCAETIQSEAKVCRYCNNALET